MNGEEIWKRHGFTDESVAETKRRNDERVRVSRESLVADGVVTLAVIAERRGLSVADALAQLEASAERGEIVLVEVDDELVVPALFLDDGLRHRPEWPAILLPLVEVGLGPWGIWFLVARPISLLSGHVLAEVLQQDPARALQAVTDYVAQLEE